MRILWICNLILPEIAEQLDLPYIPKEGWITGLLYALLPQIPNKMELTIAFPVPLEKDGCHGTALVNNHEISYCGFYEDTVHPENYDASLEEKFSNIFKMINPAVVHCFGTEFPHTLAAAKALGDPEKLLITIQGVCSEIANAYYAHLPKAVYNSRTFRDILRKDSIVEQKNKYIARGENEVAALKLCNHIGGRTEFDHNFASKCNPIATYYHAGEALRKNFYAGKWNANSAEKYRIFVSQADYPLKGFHYLLAAINQLPKNIWGQVQIYVAGQSLVANSSVKDKLKISAYGKYLLKLMKAYKLEDKVHFLGRISAEDMKAQYLKCDTYVCCSSCENSPNSLGEAMLLGTPSIAPILGGIPSMFGEQDGWLYKADLTDSFEDITKALSQALLNRWNASEEVVNDKCASASNRASLNHAVDNISSEILEIYTNIARS